ncbi:MAG: hypothetical protein JXA98_07830 [Methanosarcinaceae archaeon]|nr:hypothetical protein [Methanosarcinaceae archaeon]
MARKKGGPFKSKKQQAAVMININKQMGSKLNSGRTPQTLNRDLSVRAANTLTNTNDNVKKWRDNQRRMDTEGIDAPMVVKSASTHEKEYEKTENAPKKRESSSENASSKTPNNRKITENAIRKFVPFLLTSFVGVPISPSIVDATFHSINDFCDAYKDTEKIDDALYEGMKSFASNYAKNYLIDDLQKNVQKTDDTVFNEILNGTILVTTLSLSILESP